MKATMASNPETSTLALESGSQPFEKPGRLGFYLLTIGICFSVLLVSLDRTIVATAIPHITDQFHSFHDVGWYGSAYLITASTFKPTFGRILLSFDQKWTFLFSMVLFMIGSLVCGTAPDSAALITGRAIAGLGCAGILTGAYVAAAHYVPLAQRPVYVAAVGSMYGIGAAAGPLLGGILTDRATWRWCFYLNLPAGGMTVIFILLYFNPPHRDPPNEAFLARVLSLDPMGNLMLLVAFVMLFLALQFNEQGSAWNSPRIVGLLVGSGLVLILFAAWQRYQGEQALLPPKVVLQRTVALSSLGAIFLNGAMMILTYYLPIWFQAIKNDSAFESSIHIIPNVLANVLFNYVAAIFVNWTGFYVPPAVTGAALGAIGCGLLSRLEVNTPSSKWIGFEFLTGAGIGMAVQQSVLAVQTVLPLEMLPIGVALVGCSQDLGGATGVAVANSILQSRLLHDAGSEMPNVDVKAILRAGATRFRELAPEDGLDSLLLAYNDALQSVFIAAILMCGMAFMIGLGLEWKSVKMSKEDVEHASRTDG